MKPLWLRSPLNLYIYIKEKINDIYGKAVTIQCLAITARKAQDYRYAAELNSEAIRIFVDIQAFREVFRALLARADFLERNGRSYLFQALYVALCMDVNIIDVADLFCRILECLIKDYLDRSERLIKNDDGLLVLICSIWISVFKPLVSEGNLLADARKKFSQLQEVCDHFIRKAAEAQGIDSNSSKEMEMWLDEKKLFEPRYSLPYLLKVIDKTVGNDWMFDTALISPPDRFLDS